MDKSEELKQHYAEAMHQTLELVEKYKKKYCNGQPIKDCNSKKVKEKIRRIIRSTPAGNLKRSLSRQNPTASRDKIIELHDKYLQLYKKYKDWDEVLNKMRMAKSSEAELKTLGIELDYAQKRKLVNMLVSKKREAEEEKREIDKKWREEQKVEGALIMPGGRRRRGTKISKRQKKRGTRKKRGTAKK